MKSIILLLFFLLNLLATNLADSGEKIIGSSPECKIADYSSPESSEYILPFEVGEDFTVSQGNCGGITHVVRPNGADIRYAYDFDLQIGDKIVASRAGKVINLEEFYSNTTTKINQSNFIIIEHVDKTVAIYVHLSPKGALVNVGDEIMQGQVIGLSGASGFSGPYPHLHFDVREKVHQECNLVKLNWLDINTYRVSGCKTIPITFKNAYPLDGPPLESNEYMAVEY